jgi:hypothetical protein
MNPEPQPLPTDPTAETAEPITVASFDLDGGDGIGAALVFAFVAALGIALAVFAIPTLVVIAGWVVAVLNGLLAFRRLATTSTTSGDSQ